MTLPVAFNPQVDYQYTAFEPYKYPLDVLNQLYQAIQAVNLIKSACNLEQNWANYLEAIVLSGLIAIPKNSLIVSMIPNLLGETLRMSVVEATHFFKDIINKELETSDLVQHFQQHQLLALYGFKNTKISFLNCFADVNLTIIAEFADDLVVDLRQLSVEFIKSQQSLNVFLVFEDREVSASTLSKQLMDVDSSVKVIEIETFNLLESMGKVASSTAKINYIFIPKSFAESNYNPLVVLHQALDERKIPVDSSLLKPELCSLSILNTPKLINVDEGSVINLPAKILTSVLRLNQTIEVQISSSKLDQYLLEINELEFDAQLLLKIDCNKLSKLSTNLILQYARDNDLPIQLNYLANKKLDLDNPAVLIDYHLSNQTLLYFEDKNDHLYASGSDFTILTWGKAAIETIEFLESSESLEPEIVVLNQIWPLPLDVVVSSVKRTSRLLIIPDPTLEFPLVDIYCHQLSRKLYQYLDAPVQVVLSSQLKNLSPDLDLMFYEN